MGAKASYKVQICLKARSQLMKVSGGHPHEGTIPAEAFVSFTASRARMNMQLTVGM